MPRKWVEFRAPSHEALCQRYDAFLDGYCAAPMQIVITDKAVLVGRVVVLQRCLSGHIHTAQRVEPDLNVFAEDDDQDADATGYV